MNIIPGHKKTSFFLSLLFTLLLTVACSSSSRSQTNVDADGVALKGYDPVAYFTMGNPAKGESQFSYAWNGAVWLFANQEHKDLFAAAPEKYAPQYGGY